MYGYYAIGQSSFHLVLEFMAGGGLNDFLGRPRHISKTPNCFFVANARCIDVTTSTDIKKYEYNVAQAISWMRQAARGLAYLHDEKVQTHLHCIGTEAGTLIRLERMQMQQCK